MTTAANASLRSLLLTYSFEDHDDYGLRAIVPRAVPLDPPFTPSTLSYKAQVPADVDEVELEAPHSPQTEVEITGNTELHFGFNLVQLLLTNLQTGERIAYHVTVERQRQRSFIFRLAKIGTISSVVLIGSALLVKQITKSATQSPKEARERPSGKKNGNGIRDWPRRFGKFLEEVAVPFL